MPVEDETPIDLLVARRLKLPEGSIARVIIVRQAVDARRKTNISFVYSLDVEVKMADGQVLARLGNDRDVTVSAPQQVAPCEIGDKPMEYPPVIVGLGPAGLFAGLILAEHGYRPVVVERGRDVDRRFQDVAGFWDTGKFDAVSNVQFGEGGAGTFSDGKLTTRVNDPRMSEVIKRLIAAGAPEEIGYLHKPHIGTDKLREVVKNLRRRIDAAGGRVEFETQVTDIVIANSRLQGLIVNELRRIPCNIALLGIGHSARDTYEMLHQRGLAMEAKPFAVGVRIEHPQELIDRAQYGSMAGHHRLGAADYALVYHDKSSGRTAYSFCMCPGGIVVAASSEEGGVVTNGMSFHHRASGIANSALAVTVTTADYEGVLGGIEFQRHWERLAFAAGGGEYFAPAQTVGDFLAGKAGNKAWLTKPSYKPGIVAANLQQCLPSYVSSTLAKALPDFGARIKGFNHPQAVLTGVETRTSAPVRLLRGPDYMSLNIAGLYPMGEGAGYAGGIMSAALDGMNVAFAVMKEYQPF
jgi:hypothetical protein